MDVFSASDAIAFLRAVLGDPRVDAETGDAIRLVDLCGLLPLALRITAGRLATRPHWTIADYAKWLASERSRLHGLAVGDLDVRASFNLSYELLSSDEARAYRAVGFLGGPEISAQAVEAAVGKPVDRQLDAVADAQLLTSLGLGRYGVHDLIRLFARERLQTEEADGSAESLDRLADFYTAEAAKRQAALYGPGETFGAQPPLTWLDDEMGNIAAVATFLRERECWKALANLVLESGPLYGIAQKWAPWEALLREASVAAAALGDAELETRVFVNLQIVAAQQGAPDADRRLREAEGLARQHGFPAHQARALAHRATTRKRAGDAAGAAQLTHEALALYRQAGDRRGEARASGDLANQLDDQGQLDESVRLHEEALKAFMELDDRQGLAFENANLGIALHQLGQLQEAEEHLRTAVSLLSELGAQRHKARALLKLGEVLVDAGDLQAASQVLDEAAPELEAENDPSALERADVLRAKVNSTS